MLKMRREWRRTSSSQAEPSPWRHCWTSWASCSNVSSASNPATVTCAATPGQFFIKPWAAISACHTMERKVPPKCSPGHPTPWPQRMAASYSYIGRNTTMSRGGVAGEFPITRLIRALGSCRRGGCGIRRWRLGTLDDQPKHERQLPYGRGLGVGKHLALILRQEYPRKAQDHVGEPADGK